MNIHKIPKELFEHGHLAIYVSQKTSEDGWLKYGITSKASVAFRSCLNTQGQVGAPENRRRILAGSWIPRRFAIIENRRDSPSVWTDAKHRTLSALENRVRHNLKSRINESPEMSLDLHYLRKDYFQLPLKVIWSAIKNEMDQASIGYTIFDLPLR